MNRNIVDSIKIVDLSKIYGSHPARYAVDGLTNAMISLGVKPVDPLRQTGRVLNKLGMALQRRNGPFIVVPLMGTKFPPAFSASLRGRLILFCWDMWESNWNHWEHKLKSLKPVLVVTTSIVSRDEMRRRLPNLCIEHLPEATCVQDHDATTFLEARNIDILELGRRYSVWHDMVCRDNVLKDRGVIHLFERIKGEIIFPDKLALARGLSQSRLAICFPASTTDPQRAGPVCTMTHRYLECILSGCLVLGECPPELKSLLGYDPVIPVDWSQPLEQVIYLLSNIGKYQEHVDKVRHDLMRSADWSIRAAELIRLISLQ